MSGVVRDPLLVERGTRVDRRRSRFRTTVATAHHAHQALWPERPSRPERDRATAIPLAGVDPGVVATCAEHAIRDFTSVRRRLIAGLAIDVTDIGIAQVMASLTALCHAPARHPENRSRADLSLLFAGDDLQRVSVASADRSAQLEQRDVI